MLLLIGGELWIDRQREPVAGGRFRGERFRRVSQVSETPDAAARQVRADHLSLGHANHKLMVHVRKACGLDGKTDFVGCCESQTRVTADRMSSRIDAY